MTELLPPCTNACPVKTDVRGYLAAIARQDYGEAYRLIRANNPFPSVCAWVCPHPCEDNCRRADVDKALSIRNLKRFAVEAAGANWQAPTAVPKTSKKIAVIGSGPGGLTAAYDLAGRGHHVVIYERNQSLGGHFLTSPVYRLPREALKKDVDVILAAGVEVRTGVELGKDVTVGQLRDEYDAVIIGVGLSESRGLPLPGFDHPKVIKALPFLRAANMGEELAIGSCVLVIGGGDVAMDTARTAMRLGAEKVTTVCLEFRDQIPAHSWEIKKALEEGVHLIPGYGPVEVLIEDGVITGLKAQKVNSVFDPDGRLNPCFEAGVFKTIPCDMIIVAIGQGADNAFLCDSGLEVNARGGLLSDRESQNTNIGGIFTCGEVVTGPGPAIAAVSSGHRAAKMVDYYLNGKNIIPANEESTAIGPLPQEVAEKIPHRDRREMPELPAGERKENLLPYELGYDEEAALCEAGRCLSCGLGAQVIAEKCAACLTCKRVCPYGVPAVDGLAGMAVEGCQACGICAAICPAYAIKVENLGENKVISALDSISSGSSLVIFNGRGNYIDSLELSEPKKLPAFENALLINLPTVGALKMEWILSAFEKGAAGVAVMGCLGSCRHAGGDMLVKGLINRAKELLESVGLSRERLYYCLPAEGEDPVSLLTGFASGLSH